MKKKLIGLVTILNLLLVNVINSQSINFYRGLDLYNASRLNPAFINTDNIFQVDLLGSLNDTKKDYKYSSFGINLIGYTDKFKSGCSFSYDYSNFLSITNKNYSLGYSFNHAFSDDLTLMTGLSLKIENKLIDDWYVYSPTNSNDVSIIDRAAINYLDIGVGAIYKKLIFGINTQYYMTNEEVFEYSSRPDSVSAYNNGFLSISGLIGYEFNFFKYFSLKPQVFYQANNNIQYHPPYTLSGGLLFSYKDKYDLGIIDIKGVRSLIGSVKLNKVVMIRFMLLDFKYNNTYDKTRFFYSNENGRNLLGQISVRL